GASDGGTPLSGGGAVSTPGPSPGDVSRDTGASGPRASPPAGAEPSSPTGRPPSSSAPPSPASPSIPPSGEAPSSFTTQVTSLRSGIRSIDTTFTGVTSWPIRRPVTLQLAPRPARSSFRY